MKQHLICLSVIIITASFAYSQKERVEPKKYSIGVVAYTPVYPKGTDKFYNDHWVLPGKQDRTYTKYGLGLDFRYHLSENVSVKLWGGFSKRNLDESSHEKNVHYSNNQAVPYDFMDHLEYGQTSFNINSGINFSTKMNKFDINTGFELSYLHTGQGNETYNSKVVYDTVSSFLPFYNYDLSIDIPSGNSYGLGIFLGAEYNVLKNFSVGAEFHQFLYYSVFSGNTEYNFSFTDPYGVIFTDKRYELVDFKQFSFSSIVPMISIKYKY